MDPTSIPVSHPGDFTSILDLLEYAWILGIYWGKQLFERLKKLEDKQAISPTVAEVEARVDKELSRVISKLDSMEALIIGLIQNQSRYHPIDKTKE